MAEPNENDWEKCLCEDIQYNINRFELARILSKYWLKGTY